MAQKSSEEQINEAVETKGTEALPDAGWKRDEVLKRRQANLEEEAEELAEKLLIGAIDDKHFQVDREIAQRLEYLHVENARDDMAYYWANFVSDHGKQVTDKKTQGWEVVSGTGKDCPEAPDCIDADGTRRLGDVLLMRISRERAVYQRALERVESLRKRSMHLNTDQLAEMAARHGFKITDIDSDMQRRIEQRQATQQRQAVNQVQNAYRVLGKRLEKGGTIPGIPIPGQR